MSATLIGTTGVWGIGSDETGLIVASLDLDFQNKKKSTLTKSGETQGMIYYDETVACSLKGEVPTSSPFSSKLTATLTLANTIPALTQATISGARNVIEGIKKSFQREDMQTFDISSMLYALISAS